MVIFKFKNRFLSSNSFGLLSRLETRRNFVLSYRKICFSIPLSSSREQRLNHCHQSPILNNFVAFRSCYSKASVANNMPPPGIVHDWSLSLSPEEFRKGTDNLISRVRALYDKVAAVPDSDVNFETVLKVLNEADLLLATERYFYDSAHYVATDEGIRNASAEADRKIQDLCVELRMRKDVFNKLVLVEKSGENLKPAAKRYLEKSILLRKRNGLHLDEESQKKVKELNNKINDVSVRFNKNLTEVNTTLNFSEQELAGLPSDFLEGLKKDAETGKFEVTLKYPHYFPIMEKCQVPETRKKIEFAFNTQCIEENGPLLTEMRNLRHEAAVLLGYPSHSAYRTEILMAKNPETVNTFLDDLEQKMTPLWKEEQKYFLELKEKECSELGIHFDEKLNSYDCSYYANKCKEIKYSVDSRKLKEYFPLPFVKQSLLNIYQDLLGLKFQQIEGEVWHEDVELYNVSDAKTGELLGYFFLDLFPRPNKYFHAALFEMQYAVCLPDGSRQPAVGGMVANFSKPNKDVPALLDHNEVETFFHEFGHAMHYVCADMEYACDMAFEMERDFIEAPSQMLENWCWEKEPLKKMSSHYQDGSEIPPNLLDPLMKSQLANVGYSTLRQICLSKYDQRIHTNPEGDTKQLYYDLVNQVIGIEPQAGTHFPCNFMHLSKEYDAQYYSYLWSEVYSMDMFKTRFGEKNVLNPEVGRDYRNKILIPGGSKPAIELLRDFLGREPTPDAFLISKGLKI